MLCYVIQGTCMIGISIRLVFGVLLKDDDGWMRTAMLFQGSNFSFISVTTTHGPSQQCHNNPTERTNIHIQLFPQVFGAHQNFQSRLRNSNWSWLSVESEKWHYFPAYSSELVEARARYPQRGNCKFLWNCLSRHRAAHLSTLQQSYWISKEKDLGAIDPINQSIDQPINQSINQSNLYLLNTATTYSSFCLNR